MAEVRLLWGARAGHFIALLGRTNDLVVVADPLEGRQTIPARELASKYEFTGSVLAISPRRRDSRER
jgi:hypothetical protein